MQNGTRVLISGAGVAGLTAAIWLAREGHRPVIVERAPDVRADGYIISLSHRSYQYAAELDLLRDIEARSAGITASSYHRGDHALLRLDYRRLFEGVDVVQIMRNDLQDILFERASDLAEFRFGTTVTAITQDRHAASVTFSDGNEESFDVVLGSDGLHSVVRQLAFDQRTIEQRHLGLCSAAYRLPNVAGLAHKFETHMERDRYMVIFTTPDNGLAAVFVWATEMDRAPPQAERAQRLRRAFGGAKKLVQQVLEHCPESGEFYMDPLIQIRMAHWHAGRCVVAGDAAHCMTLISGQGATMAFTGACVLAEQLAAHPPDAAFRAYESDLRSTVGIVQDGTQSASRWYVPRSWWRQSARDVGMGVLPTAVFERYFKAKYTRA